MRCHEKHNYRIILIKDNKDMGTFGTYVKRESAQIAFKKLIDKSNNVEFPMKYVNKGKIKDVKYKIALIKKKETITEEPTKLPNEYGEYVEHISSDDKFYIFDIHEYNQEETFWVYGFHPFTERKDCTWIYKNIIKPKASKKYSFLNITLYHNKVIIETSDTFDMVICKNKSDGIRMYNYIEKKSKEDKLKYIMFSGNANSSKMCASMMIKKIMKNTGWNYMKCVRNSTRP